MEMDPIVQNDQIQNLRNQLIEVRQRIATIRGRLTDMQNEALYILFAGLVRINLNGPVLQNYLIPHEARNPNILQFITVRIEQGQHQEVGPYFIVHFGDQFPAPRTHQMIVKREGPPAQQHADQPWLIYIYRAQGLNQLVRASTIGGAESVVGPPPMVFFCANRNQAILLNLFFNNPDLNGRLILIQNQILQNWNTINDMNELVEAALILVPNEPQGQQLQEQINQTRAQIQVLQNDFTNFVNDLQNLRQHLPTAVNANIGRNRTFY